jgi:hypothetical protein
MDVWMKVTNTLAHPAVVLLTVVKDFAVQTPDKSVI